MYSADVVNEVATFLNEVSPGVVDNYEDQLRNLSGVSKYFWFRRPFKVAKSNNEFREIRPARADLGILQWGISSFLRHYLLSESKDYAYMGKGVLPAVQAHQHCLGLGVETVSLVFDLKSAFDHVTKTSVKNWLFYYLQESLSNDAVDLLTELVTYGNLTPQGCSTTPYLFNLVLLPFDSYLEMLKQVYPIMEVTRYSDNICITVEASCDLENLKSQIEKCLHGFGFEISWFLFYCGEGVEYLGTKIYGDHLSLVDKKIGEFTALLLEAISSATPEAYYRNVAGIKSWIGYICGKNIPRDLHMLLDKYEEVRTKQPRLI